MQELLNKPQPLFALILSPTRELAIQISGQFEALGSTIGVRCAALVGGIDMMQQAIALGKRPHILVGTPGRVVDHLSNTKVPVIVKELNLLEPTEQGAKGIQSKRNGFKMLMMTGQCGDDLQGRVAMQGHLISQSTSLFPRLQ